MSWQDRGNVWEDVGNNRFYLLHFRPNSTAFMPGHGDFLLHTVRDWITGCDPKKKWLLGLVGGASATGTQEGNLVLSRARAKAVEQFLAKNVPALRQPHFLIRSDGVGMGFASKDDSMRLPKSQWEAHQAIYRNVFGFLSDVSKPVPKDDPSEVEAFRKAREFEIRQVEQISVSEGFGMPGTAAIQLDAKVDFEIKDAKGRIAAYSYTGIGVALGPSLSNVLKDKWRGKKWSEIIFGWENEAAEVVKQTFGKRVGEFLLNRLTNPGKQITKGPWNAFRNRGLSLRAVDRWEGEMQLTQYGLVTNLPDPKVVPVPKFLEDLAAATGNTILNFGGVDVVLPDMKPGYAAHVENFSSGTVTFPGLLQLASSMGRLSFKGFV